MTPDPLDELVRRAVPVPAGLEARIRRSAARRRAARWGAIAAAALAAVGLAFLRPRAEVEPAVAGPVVSILEEPPAPIEMRAVEIATEVRASSEGLAVRFLKGGPSNE